MKKTRDYYFDNVKFFLVFFVILGHFIQGYINSSGFLSGIFLIIYTFHIPLFAFVSGYFSHNTYSQNKKSILRILMMYWVFKCLFFIFLHFTFLVPWTDFTLAPSGYVSIVLWYLVGLVAWKVLLPFFSSFRYAIVIACIISILFFPPFAALSKIVAFFPFFLLGHYVKENKITLHLTKWRKKACLILCFIPVISVLIFPEYYSIMIDSIHGGGIYTGIDAPLPITLMLRGIFYIFALIFVWSILQMVSKGKYMITIFGRYTLYIYVLHIFPIILLIKYLFPPMAPFIFLLVSFIMSIFILLFLSIVSFEVDFLYRKIAISRK